MQAGMPNASEILCNTRTTSGTLITIPAGRWYTGTITLSAAISVAGNNNPTITTAGAGAAPAAGTVIGRLNVTGLALSALADSVATDIMVKAPDANDITLEFTVGASGTSSGTVNGFLV